MGTRTLKYENGEKVTPLFSSMEYERRLSNLRKTMEERKLQVCTIAEKKIHPLLKSYEVKWHFSNGRGRP